MNASEALFEARKQGATFTMTGDGKVKVSALLPLPQPLLVELRKHRAELITLLRQEPDYSATACVCDRPVGGTGSERCGTCGLLLICPTCSRCRGCKLALRFNKGSNGYDRGGSRDHGRSGT
jgi:hypothetical protein